jgi:hypothetical protein
MRQVSAPQGSPGVWVVKRTASALRVAASGMTVASCGVSFGCEKSAAVASLTLTEAGGLMISAVTL